MTQLKAREITLEFTDLDEADELKQAQILSTLRSLKRSFTRQIKQYPEWDNTLRIQAVLLCTECSKDKHAQVEFTNSKNIRMTRCMHLAKQEIKINAKD